MFLNQTYGVPYFIFEVDKEYSEVVIFCFIFIYTNKFSLLMEKLVPNLSNRTKTRI